MLLEKRSYPETIAALRLVRAGQIGDVVEINSTGPHKLMPSDRPDWFFEPERYGGIIADLLTHDIDLALLFANVSAGTITGFTAGALPEYPDFALSGAVVIQAPGRLLLLEANWLTPAASAVHGDYHMQLVGDRGVADLWWARHQLLVTTATSPTHAVELGEGYRPAQPACEAYSRGEVPTIAGEDSFLATRLALLAQQATRAPGPPLAWQRQTA